MKQVEQSYRTGTMRIAEVPAPTSGPGVNLVATRVSLISAGTERQIIDLAKSSLAGKAKARPDLVRKTIDKARQEGLVNTARKVFAKLDMPIPLGYSLTGSIIESDRAAGNYPAGTRVACAGAAIANHAEYNAVPKNLLVPIPASVSDDDASFVTLGAIAVQGVRIAKPELGETVVVIGLGLLGLITVQLLKANGCTVIGVDPNLKRCELAAELGADFTSNGDARSLVSGATHDVGADCVIVTASTKSSDPLNLAAEISRMKGRVVMVGMTGMEIDRDPFYKRELDLRMSMSYGPGRYDPQYELEGHDYPIAHVRWTERRNMECFLNLVAENKVTPAKLVSHRFPIEKAQDAYDMLKGGGDYLGILLDYDSGEASPDRHISVNSKKTGKNRAKGGVAFIGFGNYARSVLLPAIKSTKLASLSSVVTSTGLSALNAAEKYGFSAAATDSAAVADDESVATVFIATRHDTHARLTIEMLNAGKNVFVEKPLALTHDDLATVMDTARSSAGELMVGFNRRFAPMVVSLREKIAVTNEPVLMRYRINAGFIPGDSWVHGTQGGGRIAGEACHFIDTMSALCDADPIEVSAFATPGHDDASQALIRFSDGSTGTIMYTSLGDTAVPKEHIEVFGRFGVGVIDDFRELHISQNGKTVKTKTREQDKGQKAMVAAFLRGVENADGPLVPLTTLEAVSQITLQMAGIEK